MTTPARSPWILCLTSAALALGLAADAPQTPVSNGPVVVIDEPAGGLPILGPMTFRAHVEPPSSSVRSILFLVDGVAVCTTTKEPFACSEDVGPKAVNVTIHTDGSVTTVPRKVVAVATLADGRRLTMTREGATIDLVENTEARAVIVPVIVTSSNGTPVTGLTKDQFEIRDEGRLQAITSFESENPLKHVIVVLDHSESMARSIGQLKSAVAKFMDGFKPPNKITLAAFNHDFRVLTNPDADQTRRRAALQGLQAVGGSALYDAIYNSLGLPTDSFALKAVVVFSDGDDLHSQSDPSALAQLVRGTSAAVYMVIRRSGPRAKEVRRNIETFVKMSGGRWLEVEDERDIQEAFAWIANVLERQYLLGFTPDQNATGPRRLSVTIKGQPKLTVLAKTEYLPPPPR